MDIMRFFRGMAIMLLLSGCIHAADEVTSEEFIRIEGQDLIAPDGSKFFIKGTNLGNWLNPEGYMFGFRKTNSARMIDQMFCEMVGPDFTAEFWKMFKDNYVTRKDIEFIASTGANTNAIGITRQTARKRERIFADIFFIYSSLKKIFKK